MIKNLNEDTFNKAALVSSVITIVLLNVITVIKSLAFLSIYKFTNMHSITLSNFIFMKAIFVFAVLLMVTVVALGIVMHLIDYLKFYTVKGI